MSPQSGEWEIRPFQVGTGTYYVRPGTASRYLLSPGDTDLNVAAVFNFKSSSREELPLSASEGVPMATTPGRMDDG